MSLNSTPNGERVQIAVFGKRNAGKSSLVNAITGQDLAIVSDVKGTTTDPVYKAMELLPIGPVTLIDTPGTDDIGELGTLRVEKALQVLNKTDIALLVINAKDGMSKEDIELTEKFKEKNIKYITVFNKADLTNEYKETSNNTIYVSAAENKNIFELKELIATIYDNDDNKVLVKDLVNKDEIVIVVTPIDSAAPKGRLILPQQQVIRDLLEAGAISTVVQVPQLKKALENCKDKPKLVITDSQAFKEVNKNTPKDIYLTSFSILFARYKGVLKYAINGVKALHTLNNGDKILISEGCTHHRQCDDIGTVKLPKWIQNFTGKTLNFEFSSGCGFPKDLSKYKMIIHCGSCMLKDREVLWRYKEAEKQGVPIANYGITIAYINGILERSIEIFSDINM